MIKAVLRAFALLLVAPMAIMELIARAAVSRDVFFEGQSQLLSLIPGRPGMYLRVAYYRMTLKHCAPDCCIEFGTVFSRSEAEVGARAYVGQRCSIGNASIGANTMLSDGVYVLSGGAQHGTAAGARAFQDQAVEFRRVTIAENCWIGTAAIVMADVGVGTVIGAGTVVTKPVPAGVVAVGVPARVVRPVAPEAVAAEAAKPR